MLSAPVGRRRRSGWDTAGAQHSTSDRPLQANVIPSAARDLGTRPGMRTPGLQERGGGARARYGRAVNSTISASSPPLRREEPTTTVWPISAENEVVITGPAGARGARAGAEGS